MLDLAKVVLELFLTFLIVSSTKNHNSWVGELNNSAHLTGLAVDIEVPDNVSSLKILKALVIVSFNRIGISKGFFHIDVDKTKSDNVWFY